MNVDGKDLSGLIAQLSRLAMDSGREQSTLQREVREGAREASLAAKIEQADFQLEKGKNDYYIAGVEGVPLVGGMVAPFLTSGAKETEFFAMLHPAAALYHFGREGVRAAHEEHAESGEPLPAALDNPVANTLVYADRAEAMENNDRATRAGIDATRHEGKASDAQDRLGEAKEQVRQAMADARSLLDQSARAQEALNKLV